MGCQKSAEAIVGAPRTEGPNMMDERVGPVISMDDEEAQARAGASPGAADAGGGGGGGVMPNFVHCIGGGGGGV